MDLSNDPELDGKYLGSITTDFVKISDTLKEASYQLIDRDISNYPIFPISKNPMNIGQLLLGKTEMDLSWNFNFSFLENLIGLEIIMDDKKDDFIRTFKDPEEYACLLVIDHDFMKFVYVPFPED